MSGPDKRATGLDELDTVLKGGLPAGRSTLVLGGPGAGKTILGLQVLANAVSAGGTGILISFEESVSEILANAEGFDWDPAEYRGSTLHVLDGRAAVTTETTGEFDLGGLIASLDALVQQNSSAWILLDGVDQVLDMLADPHARRREFLRLATWLGDQNRTTLITAKTDTSGAEALEAYGFMQFAVPCVIALQRTRSGQASARSLEILKYRGSSFDDAALPYVIDETGIRILARGGERAPRTVSRGRVSTGIEALDPVVGGGYLRGSTTLISGPPGTAKTTLASSFAAHMAGSGEPVLQVAFDEDFDQVVADMTSIGLDLATHRTAGLLHGLSLSGRLTSPEALFSRIRAELDRIRPAGVIVDPISTLVRLDPARGGEVVGLLVDELKARGITTVLTALTDKSSVWTAGEEPSSAGVSTIADTWITLSFAIARGERNRALSVIKSRGSAHATQVRELILSDRGVDLAEVYELRGELLMGSARIAEEADAAAEERRSEAEAARRERELDAQTARLEAELAETRARLQGVQAEREIVRVDEDRRRAELTERRQKVRAKRDRGRETSERS